ncbi:MAG TPA: biotin--[acetyl-CoA-carboxylase] ligase [Alphaproteobacteria bacterium]|nr:biotin--[acetyl-CoA-carboxylase] ligase [Alphaproteobacteria bacterium]
MSLPISFRAIYHPAIDATNEEARRIAEGRVDAGWLPGEVIVVWAGEQTAGRGRRGRQWVSKPGNLYASLLMRPDFTAEKAMQLGFVAANGLAEAVSGVLAKGTSVTCKWPNDILIEGRKVSGILLETSMAAKGANLQWLIIGFGVNIEHFPGDAEFPATSLIEEGANREKATPALLLEAVCRRFQAGLACWRKRGFAPARDVWLLRAHGLGGPIRVRLERRTVDGTFRELDGDGALILETGAGETRRITAGDVFLRDFER